MISPRRLLAFHPEPDQSLAMIAAFVTSHGFGHLNRTVAVLNLIPPAVPITIFSDSSLFPHWRERLTRHADFVHLVCDSGAYNPPGDSQATDGHETLRRAQAVHRQAHATLDADLATLRRIQPRVVLSDAASLPLVYAHRLGIPGYLLANFTWADIYRPHARNLGQDELRFVGQLAREYRLARAILRTEPALSMKAYRVPIEDVGMVTTKGRERKAELRKLLGLSRNESLIYFYMGRYGQTQLGWENIEKLGRHGYHFVGFHHPSVGPLPNFHVVPPDQWTGADLANSADIMVAKAGYGTVCEALAARIPMLYAPRTGFAEHRALDRTLQAWGGGVRVNTRQFHAMNLRSTLDRARNLRPGPSPINSDGASRVAAVLTSHV